MAERKEGRKKENTINQYNAIKRVEEKRRRKRKRKRIERIERRGNRRMMREQETRELGGECVMDSADQLIYSGAV